MNYVEKQSVEKYRQFAEIDPVEQLEINRFNSLFPEMYVMYKNGWMPVAVAEKYDFPISVVSELFVKIQNAESFGTPILQNNTTFFFPQKDAEKQKYHEDFKTMAYLKTVGIAVVCISAVYAAYIFVTEVLGTWIVAFSEGAIPVVTFLGKVSIPAAILLYFTKSYFSKGKDEKEVEPEIKQAANFQKQNNTQVNVTINQ